MKVSVLLDELNRIISYAIDSEVDGGINLKIPNDFDVFANDLTLYDYNPTTEKLTLGEREPYIDPSLEIKEKETQQSEILKLFAYTLPDEVIKNTPLIFDNWEDFIGKKIDKDVVVRYGDKLIRVVQEHNVLEIYPPSSATSALYREIVKPVDGGETQILPWEDRWNMSPQKEGYLEGDIVTHGGFYWTSLLGVTNNWNYYEPNDANWVAWKKGEPL